MTMSTERKALRDPDAFYEALIDAHQGLDAEQSHELNARLILLLAGQIGDDATLHALLRTAVSTARSRDTGTGNAPS